MQRCHGEAGGAGFYGEVLPCIRRSLSDGDDDNDDDYAVEGNHGEERRWRGKLPFVVILPGTGDHNFRRRRQCVSAALARSGVASVILEGPFCELIYGTIYN